jgi:hypothetical protein
MVNLVMSKGPFLSPYHCNARKGVGCSLFEQSKERANPPSNSIELIKGFVYW